MRVAIHASRPDVYQALRHAVAQGGYGISDDDSEAHVVLVDLALGIEAVRAVCTRLVGAGLGPLVAVVGDPSDEGVEELVEAGVTLCVGNDTTLVQRLR